jgi:hypothetical protein
VRLPTGAAAAWSSSSLVSALAVKPHFIPTSLQLMDLAIEFAPSSEYRAGARLKSSDLLDYRRLCSQ